MRDRLIELLRETFNYTRGVCIDFDEAVEINADHILADGWIRPPCKVGDTVYYIAYRSNDGKTEKYIKEETVEMISIDSRSIYAHIPRALLIDLADLGKTVFLTREQAERVLAERSEK